MNTDLFLISKSAFSSAVKGVSNIRKTSVFKAIILMAALGLPFLFYHNRHNYTSTFFSLDTVVTVKSDKNITEPIKNEIIHLDTVFGCYSGNSEVSELNRKKRMICSPELADFISQTEELCRTCGYGVDISAGNLTKLWHDSLENRLLPDDEKIADLLETNGQKNIVISGNEVTLKNGTCIDPGAAAKGYALDRIKDICVSSGSEYTVVSTGSSTLLYSSDPEHVFTCGIKADKENIAGTAEVKPCFVSTSGDYERCTEINGKSYHHILDMNTGYPSETGLSSVTVFCDSGLKSDFLSTLIFAEGTEGIEKYLDSDEFQVVAVDKKGNILKSDSLDFTGA